MDSAKRFLLVALLGLLATSTIGVASFGPNSRDRPTAEAVLASQRVPSLRIARCTTVETGETFTVDIWGLNVTNLLAWEIYFAYDPEILELIDRDVRVFLQSQPNSNVIDFSDPVPNNTGLYRVAAADLGSKQATEDGSGILVHLTMTAQEPGVSPAFIDPLDFDGDGIGDLGPTLTGINESGGIVHLGDTENADGIFDGTIVSGQIAVGMPCVTPEPEPSIEEMLETLPSIATPSLLPLPEEGEPSDPGSHPTVPPTEVPEGQTPSPDQTPDQTPTQDGTPAQGATPNEPLPPSGPGGGDNAVGQSDGFPTWLIAVIAAVAGSALALSVVIIRTARRLI